MKIVIAGASGLIGRPLVAALLRAGHQVRRLVRHPESASDAILWQPHLGEVDVAALGEADAVINLAGENVAAGRWTRERRRRILASRIESTRTLVDGIERAVRKPTVLVNASAAGFYGNRGDAPMSEAGDAGTGFLADVCRRWEAEANRAGLLGVRTVALRFGVVLASDGGALAKMLPVFRVGLGGRLAHGKQWMSWVDRDDAIRAIVFAVDRPDCEGPVNVAAPHPVTNADFTVALGRALRRPAGLAVPRWALRLAFGEMADETVLASTRILPTKLGALGFSFQYPEIDGALRHAVSPHVP